MKKKYPVILTETERDNLKGLIAAGTAPARKLTHACILLKADRSPQGPGWVNDAVAEAVEVSQPTGQATRRQAGDPLHAQARQLAKHGRDRAQRAQPTVP
jgi:hypothetical protein